MANRLMSYDAWKIIFYKSLKLILSIQSKDHSWKKPMSPPVVHFVVCVAAPNFWAFLLSFVRRRPNFWAFLRSFARHRLKNWISVGDHR